MPKGVSRDQKQQRQKTRQSQELWRQKNILFKRLKQMNQTCHVSTLSIIITEAGVPHVHYSPDLKHKVEDCVKPLVDFIVQKQQLSKSCRKCTVNCTPPVSRSSPADSMEREHE